jgi:hypothetical protein
MSDDAAFFARLQHDISDIYKNIARLESEEESSTNQTKLTSELEGLRSRRAGLIELMALKKQALEVEAKKIEMALKKQALEVEAKKIKRDYKKRKLELKVEAQKIELEEKQMEIKRKKMEDQQKRNELELEELKALEECQRNISNTKAELADCKDELQRAKLRKTLSDLEISETSRKSNLDALQMSPEGNHCHLNLGSALC